MSRIHVGCCGAYCGTCREFSDGRCRGCKLGYDTGERALSRARCAMKRCCLERLGISNTCADCEEYGTCDVLGSFYGKGGYKYRKYMEAAEYIRRYGYDAFVRETDGWRGPYGILRPPANGDRNKR